MQLRVRNFKIPSWSVAALFYGISIVSLVWVFLGVNLSEMLLHFQRMHWRWLVFAMLTDVAVYVYQGWRWGLLLRPVERIPLWQSVQAIYVGLFANEVLPFRPGEVIRPYLQALWSEIPFSVALSSVIIERIFDGIWLAVVFVTVSSGLALPPKVTDMALVLAVVSVVAAIALGIVMFGKRHAHAAVANTPWGGRLKVLVDDLHLMGRSPSFYVAAFASFPYLLMQAIPLYAMIRGYGQHLTMGQVMVVLVVYRLGTAIPQLPGNLGMTQSAIVIGLSLFGVDKTTAAGLSMVAWGVITAPLVVAGFFALLLTGSNIKDIHRRAKAHVNGPLAAPKAGAP